MLNYQPKSAYILGFTFFFMRSANLRQKKCMRLGYNPFCSGQLPNRQILSPPPSSMDLSVPICPSSCLIQTLSLYSNLNSSPKRFLETSSRNYQGTTSGTSAVSSNNTNPCVLLPLAPMMFVSGRKSGCLCNQAAFFLCSNSQPSHSQASEKEKIIRLMTGQVHSSKQAVVYVSNQALQI